MRTAVIDSSALINLAHLNLATTLSQFFQIVYVPRNVQREVNRKARFRYRLRKLYRRDLFKKCAASDKVQVNWLAHELDEGEAEALVQAREKGATFFIGDERRARKIGENMGLKVVGTVRILARLHLERLAEEPRRLVRRLRKDLRYRVTDEVVDQAIDQAPEPI